LCMGVEVYPLPMEHYDEDRKVVNYGYYIKVDDEFNILFVTDTKFIPQDLTDIKFDLIFIEANYLEDKVRFAFKDAENNRDYGKVARYKRLLDSHFSLENVARTLTGMINKNPKPYDLSNCKAIFLTHLSSGKDTNDSYYRQFLTNYLTANKELVKMPNDLKIIVMKQKGGML
jgi:ribonuclease BN (tRNA processing enzyme)